MFMTRFVVGIFSVVLTVLGAGVASGQQNYPNKPIRIIVGGLTGTTASVSRLIAQGISGPLGQQVIVESRGSSAIIGEIVGKAPPDGYTLLISGGSLWLAPLTRKMPYDPVRDLSPISMVGLAPWLLVVHPSLPVKSVKELIAYAKARPGELNYSIGGIGGTGHLAGELFKAMAGVNIVAISYRDDSQEVSDLISGRLQLTITSPATIMEQVKLGKMRALAVGSAAPSAMVPELPTIAATLPGYEAVQANAMYAPANTPEAIIQRIYQEVVRYLKTTEAKEQFLKIGNDIVGSSPDELAATMKSEMARFGKVIKDVGIKVE